MGSELKAIRGQLRQIVKDMLPDMLTEAFRESIWRDNDERLKKLEEQNKELLSWVMRSTLQAPKNPK